MKPEDFVRKWGRLKLSETQAAKEHFIDLCRVLGQPTPADADGEGDFYCFERRVAKVDGRPGRADVWKRGFFAWEYKSPGKDLDTAFAQLQRYAPALANPPLLIVSDMVRIRIHTNWTNVVSTRHELTLADILVPERLDLLRFAFENPEGLKPAKTREALTEEAAGRFATLAARLENRGHAPVEVARFVIRLVFCMFAENVGLLPGRLFSRMLERAHRTPNQFQELASELFETMRTGGRIGFEDVEWFNGGLFNNSLAFALEEEDVALVLSAAAMDWSDIDPSIMGTLFERGLNPELRQELAQEVARRDAAGQSQGAVGVYYTPSKMIERLVDPVVIRPLRQEWLALRHELIAMLPKRGTQHNRPAAQRAQALFTAFVGKVKSQAVLDPACGSGNFLYVALLALKDFHHEVILEGEALGLHAEGSLVGPDALHGFEVNPLAVELARASVWIGEIQWMQRHGMEVSRRPVLRSLQTVVHGDALIDLIGGEVQWPRVQAIVGNPPFVGNKGMLKKLGKGYVTRLRSMFADRVPGSADMVCYWFEKARAMVEAGHAERVGLVTTSSIRTGSNRAVLDRVAVSGRIFEAWSDEPWIDRGAAVRVSMVCFGGPEHPGPYQLDGKEVSRVNADLTASAADLTRAMPLSANTALCFQGPVKVGPFEVEGWVAREWLSAPTNPGGKPNSDVLRPWINGKDITSRPSDTWIIDFGSMSDKEAALYEAPFEHVKRYVKPLRDANGRPRRREHWWQHGELAPALREGASSLSRVIATPRVSKHRLFVWVSPLVLPDSRVNVILSEDDVTFGILHSRFHEAWSLRLGGRHGVGNDPQYTPTTGFETFPFPEGLKPGTASASAGKAAAGAPIAEAARHLNRLRREWLNPPELVHEEEQPMAGLPPRLVPNDAKAASILAERTLTRLYNTLPQWLVDAHRDLDRAVASAYGWENVDLPDDEALERLLALNLAEAAVQEPDARGKRRAIDPREPQFLLLLKGKGIARNAASRLSSPQAAEGTATVNRKPRPPRARRA